MLGRNGSDRTARLQNIKPFFVTRSEGAGVVRFTTCSGSAYDRAANRVLPEAETSK